MKVYKVPHLSRKSTLRSLKCYACHAKRRGANATHFVRQLPPTSMKAYKGPHPVTQIDPEVSKVPRLSRETPQRQCDPLRPPASADLYEGLQSATPVTQIDPEVSKVPRLSRETPRRQCDPLCPPGSADLYEGLQSATPVTRNAAAPNATHLCPPGSADLYEGLQSATPVTQTDPEVSKVPHLSPETPRRQCDPLCPPGSADLYEGLQSATPVTQIDPEASKVPHLSRETPQRQCDPLCPPGSADLYEGLQSATPATQSLLLSHIACTSVLRCCVAVVVLCCVAVVVVVEGEEEGGGRREGEEEEEEGDKEDRGVATWKQKPHNTMWGKTTIHVGKYIVRPMDGVDFDRLFI